MNSIILCELYYEIKAGGGGGGGRHYFGNRQALCSVYPKIILQNNECQIYGLFSQLYFYKKSPFYVFCIHFVTL